MALLDFFTERCRPHCTAPTQMTTLRPTSLTGKGASDQRGASVSNVSQNPADRRAYPRTKVSVQTELHLGNQDAPMQEHTSDLSLGGCYVRTMATIPVGTRLDVALWLGKEKVTIGAIVVTCYPQVGNGIQFIAIPPADRNRVQTFLESYRDSD